MIGLKSLVFVIATFAIQLVQCESQTSCTVLQHSNGCSTPLGLPVPYKTLFTPACLGHDACYRCGERYGWSQDECDVGFKKSMYQMCKDNYASLRKKRSISAWGDLKEIYEKIRNGWKKATENKTTKDEAKRLWNEALSIFKMIAKWPFVFGKEKKCQHGANIYYHAVKSFGVYAFRLKSKDYCNEKCAERLGKP